MSKLDVTSIASLEALNSALSKYRTASDEPFHSFAPTFSEKLELLAQLEAYFEEKIRQAERELASAQFAYFACTSNPKRTSCSSEASRVRSAEAALARAKANLATYKSVMSQLRGSFGGYQGAASRYENNLQNISSSIVPNFAQLTSKMRLYSDDQSAIFGDGVEAGSPINYTGGVSNVTYGATLGGIGVDGASSGAPIGSDVAGNILNESSNISVGDKAVDAMLEGDITATGTSSENGFSTSTVIGAGVIGGVSVAAVSAMILLHFKNNGVDNAFAEDLIRVRLAEKYGVGSNSVHLLPPDKHAEFVKDYNALSKAVEEDVKKQYTKEVEELRKKENKKRAKEDSKNHISIEEAEKQYEYSTIAAHVYNPSKSVPDNWSRVTSYNIDPAYELVNEIERLNKGVLNGFHAELYKNKFTGEYTLAFRGTEPLKLNDWGSNGLQVVGLSGQYKKAKKLGDIINRLAESGKIDKSNFKIVGHSLGGGLATVAGLTSRCQTYTYNQAELSQITIRSLKLNLEGHEKIITQHLDRNQWLNLAQDSFNSTTKPKCSTADRFIQNAPAGQTSSELMKSIVSNSKKRCEIPKIDSSDNPLARLGTVKIIDSKGSHGIVDVQDFFNSKKATNLYGNKLLQNFNIQNISEVPSVDNSSIHLFQQAAQEAGIVGVVSKSRK